MHYRSFTFNIIIHISLIVLNIAALILLLQNSNFWATSIGLALLLTYQIWQLIYFIEKTHRDINNFFDAVLVDDFTRRISQHSNTSAGLEIHAKLSNIQLQFQNLCSKHEALTRYYSLLLEKIPVAILTINGQEVTIVNPAAEKLFQRSHLKNTESLNQFGKKLAEDIQQILPSEQRTSQIIVNKTAISLTLSAASIQLSDATLKIVSLNPIQRELDRQEIIAWQNLVQVFTHEIMNSMTPISSLSKTAVSLLESSELLIDSRFCEIITDVQQAISIVASRSEHLMGFVQAYRRIASLPKIQRSNIQVQQLFNDVCQLFVAEARRKCVNIYWQVIPENLTLNADPIQIEQVLINLLKNALEAFNHPIQGEIQLHAYIGAEGHIHIDISDNGCGIPSDRLEQIFVPFYTSKSEGTGIGLFLVKQIMQAHLGSVYATASEGSGATFRLIF
jgi:two-component system, NtrC family, nitrogen regulation sensor histidine kinase NtrY